MDGFVKAYAERDKSMDFSDWLTGRLEQEMPDLPSGTSEKLSAEIIQAVAGYDRALSDLNEAVEGGQSKESWLADRAAEAYAGMTPEEAGNALQRIDNGLNASNTRLMSEIEGTPEIEVTAVETIETADWNEYSLKEKALDIGRQAVMSGLGAAMDTVKANMESGEPADVGGVLGQALQDGLQTAKGEVKAVVAGAIKTAAEKGLTDLLPADTPTETITDLACVAVEGAGALFDAATGKCTMTEALDKTGRAGVAAGARWCAGALKGALVSIPVVGPLVADLAGGLLDHVKSPKFTENVYVVVRDAAIATWEGIKESGRRILSGLNSIKEALFN